MPNELGDLRRFVWITKDERTRKAWVDLVIKKGITKKDLILLLGAMGIRYEFAGSVSPDRSNLPEVAQLLEMC